jgi:hypothetical protein
MKNISRKPFNQPIGLGIIRGANRSQTGPLQTKQSNVFCGCP